MLYRTHSPAYFQPEKAAKFFYHCYTQVLTVCTVLQLVLYILCSASSLFSGAHLFCSPIQASRQLLYLPDRDNHSTKDTCFYPMLIHFIHLQNAATKELVSTTFSVHISIIIVIWKTYFFELETTSLYIRETFIPHAILFYLRDKDKLPTSDN